MNNDRPSTRLPARVYWMRRAMVLIALGAVVAVVVWLVGLVRGEDEPTPQGDSQPGSSEVADTPVPEETEVDQAGAQDCAPAALGITIAADAASYVTDALPTFTVTIQNTGSSACLIDAGDAQREILITSGDDRIWSSRDCPVPETQVRELLLGPAGSETATDVTTVQWSRSRSAPECPADQESALAGTYSTALTVGTAAAATPAVFVLE